MIDRPWHRPEHREAIILPERLGVRQSPNSSFYGSVTIPAYLPGRQKSRRHICQSCTTPAQVGDKFCGWCGVRLDRA